MGGSNGELEDLTNRLMDRARASRTETSTEKAKVMTNSTNTISADISMNGQKLEAVTSFKYLGATLCKDGTCSAEDRTRIASAMAGLIRMWRFETSSRSTSLLSHQDCLSNGQTKQDLAF